MDKDTDAQKGEVALPKDSQLGVKAWSVLLQVQYFPG